MSTKKEMTRLFKCLQDADTEVKFALGIAYHKERSLTTDGRETVVVALRSTHDALMSLGKASPYSPWASRELKDKAIFLLAEANNISDNEWPTADRELDRNIEAQPKAILNQLKEFDAACEEVKKLYKGGDKCLSVPRNKLTHEIDHMLEDIPCIRAQWSGEGQNNEGHWQTHKEIFEDRGYRQLMEDMNFNEGVLLYKGPFEDGVPTEEGKVLIFSCEADKNDYLSKISGGKELYKCPAYTFPREENHITSMMDLDITMDITDGVRPQ